MKCKNMQTIETKNKPQIKAPRVAPLEGASTYAPAGAYVSMHCGGHDADERRFIESGIQRIFVDDIDGNLINIPQRAQSSMSEFGNKPQQWIRTRMTRIRRIFTDTLNPCASASSVQSVFYSIPSWVSSFICVHLRLIFSRQIRKVN